MAERETIDIEAVLAQPDLIVEAVRRGAQQAIRKHKSAGLPMAAWRGGKVVWIPPEELPELNGENEQHPSARQLSPDDRQLSNDSDSD